MPRMSATPLGPVQVTERLEISAAGLPTSPAPGSHTTSQNEAIVSGGRSARRLLDIAAGAAFCLPFILYYVNVIRYGVDVPIQDDYGTFLGTVLNWLRAPGLVERLSGIVAQHNSTTCRTIFIC